MPTPYETAYRIACEKLATLDLNDAAFNSSARLDGKDIHLNLLNEAFCISESGRKISILNSGDTIQGNELELHPLASFVQTNDNAGRPYCVPRIPKISEKILLLHYLITADGTPLQQEEITLQNVPGASFYYPTYKSRTIDLLYSRFAQSPSKLIDAAKNIGFTVVENTNQSCRLKTLVLPNVPVSFVLWLGKENNLADSESIKILYNASITHYLPLEDIIILTELITHKMIK